jgi:hypothetical protein
MKRKLLSAAISSIALTGLAQNAQATSYDLYLAGSSAQDNLIIAEVYKLCVPGTFTYYVDNNIGIGSSSSWGNNYKAYTCTVSTSFVSGVNSGDVVTFHKTNFGGSATGVAPLFDNAKVPVLNIANSNCTLSISGGTSKVGSTSSTVPTFGCTTTNTNDLVSTYLDAGISDVNPTFFQGVNQTTAYTQNGSFVTTYPNVTKIPNGFTVVPANALVWAVPVSLNLYGALQAAQGLLNVSLTVGSVTLAAGSCTVGQYSIDPNTALDGSCIPSLNKAQLTSLISGATQDWGQFSFNGVNLLAAATAYDAVNTTANLVPTVASAGSSPVFFCQRTAGSGTAASQYAYFLNQPANQVVSQINPISAAAAAVASVFSIADGGNMESCLTDFAVGSAAALDYTASPVNTVGQTAWAFGQQSSDKNASATKAYRFVKLDHVAPTLANAYSGDYDFVNESTWQYATTAASGRSQQYAIVKQLISNVTDPATVGADLDAFTKQQFGYAGFFGTAANAYSHNSAFVLPASISNTVAPTYPVTPWTRTNVSGVLDNGVAESLSSSPNVTVTP